MSSAKIIGIGGVSQSGKSSLAEKIKQRFTGKTLLISQDDFTVPENEIPKIKDRTDWEHPGSIDFQKIRVLIKDSRPTHDLIIVEGLLAFYEKELTDCFDLKIMARVSKETFINRRKKETRWGVEPDWFIEHVWESFLKYGDYGFADYQVSGETQISEKEIDVILNKLNLA